MIKELLYWKRNCDCCGSDKLEEIWFYETKARTKSFTYTWKVRNVVCTVCGFAFVSPCPTEKSLNEYYADSYEYFRGQPLDYSIENRITLLQKHISNHQHLQFLEVGGNTNERFQSALTGLFEQCINVELNLNCDSQFQSLDTLPRESTDVIAAYFVLEHVQNPTKFLESCVNALKYNGLLFIEVPNLYIYPLNPAGLALWEHTNHFSPYSLALIAEVNGLRLLDLSYSLCSRPYGFAAVFLKSRTGYENHSLNREITIKKCEYYIANACLRDGLHVINAYHKSIKEVQEKIMALDEAKEWIVIWAANKVCFDLLENFELPKTAVVVDSNPDKKNYLNPIPVYQPHEVKDIILRAKFIVINTGHHSEKIVNFIKNEIGRDIQQHEMSVIKAIG